MNTLLFTLEYPPQVGGVANVYENLVKFWPRPEEIFVLNNNKGKLINKKMPIWKWLPAINYLRDEIKKNNIRHVIVGHILPLGTATWLLSLRMNFTYSVFLHGMDFSYAVKNIRKRWLTRKILKKAEHIICANSYVMKEVKRLLGNTKSGKVKVVNPGISKKSLITNPKLQIDLKQKYNLVDKIVLFSVGRLVRRKGFDKVIEALPKVLEKVPNLVYIIAGEGEEKKNLENIGRNAPRRVRTIFLGKISDEEKWAWLDLCDIFIMPARDIDGDYEGFGIVYLEANLAGKPVIAGDSGGVGDAVKNNVNGLLVNSENVDDIAGAIIKLSRDKELREKLGAQGKERAIKEFSWEKQVRKIYRSIIG